MTGPWDHPAPGEDEAGARAWRVVCAAFEEREPVPRPRRHELRPLLVLAAALLGAAALGTAGATVVGAIRGQPNARSALDALPAAGRLLLTGADGTWVVNRDGSKRRLGGYSDATWSPRGLYIAAIRGHELVALEPDGDVRWSLARRGRIRVPSWNSPDGFRIAYVARGTLRVVAGDGTGDRSLSEHVAPVKPAWQPGRRHVLAFADCCGITVVEADTQRVLWHRRLGSPATGLEWSADGRRLLAVARNALRVYDSGGRLVARDDPSDGTRAVAATFVRGGHGVVVIRGHGTHSEVVVLGTGEVLFRGAGEFGGVAWSPDGRWLLVAWPSADQLLFIRSAAVRRVVAFSGVSQTFGSFPRIAGWSR